MLWADGFTSVLLWGFLSSPQALGSRQWSLRVVPHLWFAFLLFPTSILESLSLSGCITACSYTGREAWDLKKVIWEMVLFWGKCKINIFFEDSSTFFEDFFQIGNQGGIQDIWLLKIRYEMNDGLYFCTSHWGLWMSGLFCSGQFGPSASWCRAQLLPLLWAGRLWGQREDCSRFARTTHAAGTQRWTTPWGVQAPGRQHQERLVMKFGCWLVRNAVTAVNYQDTLTFDESLLANKNLSPQRYHLDVWESF